jgi:hypothetical protein
MHMSHEHDIADAAFGRLAFWLIVGATAAIGVALILYAAP